MPKLFGPENRRFYQQANEEGTGFVQIEGKPIKTNATSLREAISDYEQAFSVSVAAYDGSDPEVPLSPDEPPKYFLMRWVVSNQTSLVDIHITRGGKTICPKQDLNYALEASDILEFGPLVC